MCSVENPRLLAKQVGGLLRSLEYGDNQQISEVYSAGGPSARQAAIAKVPCGAKIRVSEILGTEVVSRNQ